MWLCPVQLSKFSVIIHVSCPALLQTTDPWSRTSSPPVADPWLNSASALPPPASSKPPLMGAAGPGATGGQLDAWAPLRTQSPSVTSGSSVEGWLQNGAGATAPAGTNGNVDPWLNKSATPSAVSGRIVTVCWEKVTSCCLIFSL